MGKKGVRLLAGLLCCLILTGSCFAAELTLVPLGQTVGLRLQARGLVVAGFSDVSPARDAGLQTGDVITAVNGETIEEPQTLTDAAAQGESLRLTVEREGSVLEFAVTPVRDAEHYRLGLYVRGSISGIGTLTYYDPRTGAFGALGHGVNDTASHKLLPFREGSLVAAEVTGVQRGTAGTPGCLQGSFEPEQTLGSITGNTRCGIFGVLQATPEGEALPVAEPGEVHLGAATIRCCVSGREVREYAVELLELDPGESAAGRNLLLEVRDKALLEATGGIVQGMSGSPIIQDGRLVGAVTHVLVNDSAKGYGILIENMLRTAA